MIIKINPKTKGNNGQIDGFSLIELLISIIIFGFISAGIVIAMRSSFQTTHLSRNLDELAINLNQSLDIMKLDIQNAGRYVSAGIIIPNNPVDTTISFGFDQNSCINNIPVNTDITDIGGNIIGFIPQGTDTIAIATMAPPEQLNLMGCDPNGPAMGPQPITVSYISGASFLDLEDASDFSCYMNNNLERPVFAVLFASIGGEMISEMFTIDSILGNNLDIADDSFSGGLLSRDYPRTSRVYMLGTRPNTGKIEYFILESYQPNPRDPDVPLRQLVKRVNNREIFPVSDNITNLQIDYIMYDGTRLQNLNPVTLNYDYFPVIVEIMLTARTADMVRGDPDTPDDIDPVTLTNRARYLEETHHSVITVKGTTYKSTFEVATPYYP